MLKIAGFMNVALALAVLYMVYQNAIPATEPQIFIFSYIRFAALSLLILLAGYLLVSSLVPKLIRLNMKLAVLAAICVILNEAVLRLFPAVMGSDLMRLLPPTATREILAERQEGHEGVTGAGMLHYWAPGTRSNRYDWVVADANGFRNESVPTNEVHTVMLGSSILLSAATKETYASKMNALGTPAYSLAMGSYSVLHQAKAYRRFIVDRGVDHERVNITVNLPYDLHKATAAKRLEDSGGDWIDFLYGGGYARKSGYGEFYPWTFAIIERLPVYLINRYRDWASRETRPVGKVEFDYGGFEVTEAMLGIKFNQLSWEPFELGLNRIFELAADAGAVPVVVLFPPGFVRALDYLKLHNPDDKKAADLLRSDYQDAVQRLRSIAKAGDARFIDLTGFIVAKIEQEDMFLSPQDMHFNEHGIDLSFEYLYKTLNSFDHAG